MEIMTVELSARDVLAIVDDSVKIGCIGLMLFLQLEFKGLKFSCQLIVDGKGLNK